MYLSSLDLSSRQFSRNPYPFYEELRKSGEVHYLPKNNTWLVIGFKEIVEITTNPSTFTSTGNNSFDPILLNCDPPKHTKHRKILAGDNAPLSSKRIDLLELANIEIAKTLIDSLKNRDSFDVLKDFSLPFSSLVILNLLGISTEKSEELKAWSLSAVSSESIHDPNFAEQKWLQLKPILIQEINKVKKTPNKNGLAEMIFHSFSKDQFSEDDILDLTKVLLLGGNETTPNLVSSALYILLRDKNLLAKVKRDLSWLDAVINETLRLEAPTQIIERTATEDIEIAGIRILKNSAVSLAIGAANRDPREFSRPNEFIVDRKESKILSFGFGPHYCIGARLAKQEAKIALEQLLTTFSHLRLTHSEKITYRHSSHVRGIKQLNLRVDQVVKNDLSAARKNCIELLKKEQLSSGEFPTYEFYPNIPDLEAKGWHNTLPSPFIHANIANSLINLKQKTFSEEIKKAIEFIVEKKEKGDVWRFWELGPNRNNVPADVDDTALCSLVLKQNGVALHNNKLILSNQNKGNLYTWFLPEFNMIFSNPALALKWMKEKQYYQPTINSNMLSKEDYELGVMANVLAYLGENEETIELINGCIKSWKSKKYNTFFYNNEIVIAFHIARAYRHGIVSFKKLENEIVKEIQKGINRLEYTELILSGLILKYFENTSELSEQLKNKIMEITCEESFKFPHFAYFTSKDRNYVAGSNCLVASWFLDLSEEWV